MAQPLLIGFTDEQKTLRGLPATASKRPLETGSDPLPELSADQLKVRRWWRHPAFILSLVFTLLAGGAAIFLLLRTPPVPVASSPALDVSENNAHVRWAGPAITWDLYVVGGPSAPVSDISQLIRGTEAWVPRGALLIDDNSCFVVRPAGRPEPVSLDPAELTAQGAVSTCMGPALARAAAPADPAAAETK